MGWSNISATFLVQLVWNKITKAKKPTSKNRSVHVTPIHDLRLPCLSLHDFSKLLLDLNMARRPLPEPHPSHLLIKSLESIKVIGLRPLHKPKKIIVKLHGARAVPLPWRHTLDQR